MKRTAAILLAIIAVLALAAFSEEADLLEGSRLVGVLITREDLSAYAGEAGVLPASCTHEGPDREPEYTFGNVDGLRLICFSAPDEDGDGGGLVSNVDDGFSAVHFDLDDDGSSITMEAAIDLVPGDEEELFFFDPVLLSVSGQVFAVPGDFMAVSAAMDPPGSTVGQTIRDERKHTENGSEMGDTTTITVQINAVREPVKIRFLQFSEAHELLKSEEFLPGRVPDQIVPLPGAEYLLLETVERDPDGKCFTRREVIGRDMDGMTTLSCRDDGICLCHYCDVRW